MTYEAVAEASLAMPLACRYGATMEHGSIWKDRTSSFALNVDAHYLRVAVSMMPTVRT